MAAVEATDCAIDGTVNEANLEVLAFDCAGVAGDKTLVSGGAIFDAMTMGCFKFDSTLDGLTTMFDFSIVLADLVALAALSVLAATTGLSAFLTIFFAGASTVFADLIGFATTTGLTAVFAAGFTTSFSAGLTAVLTTALDTSLGASFEAGLETGFKDLTALFTATLDTTLTAAFCGVFSGAFLTAFFATVFIHCLPAKLVFIQIKQSTHTHQKTNAFTFKLLRIYLHSKVVNKYSTIAKNQSARGL